MATVMGVPATQTSSGNDEQRLARAQHPNEWRVGSLETPLRRPGAFCTAAACPWCMSYYLRKRALHGDMRRYVCCGGAFPCSGRCGEQKAPEFCLAMETACCFPSSVAVTRFMIQDEMVRVSFALHVNGAKGVASWFDALFASQGVRDSPTDTCLIATQFAIAQLACICSCAACITGSNEIASIANCLTCAADIGWCLLCGCLQAQHYDQLEARDTPAAATITAPPRAQQMVAGLPPPPPFPPPKA